MHPNSLDGTYWSSPESPRNKTRSPIEQKSKRKVSDSTCRGRPPLLFEDLEESSKEKKVNHLHSKILQAIADVLQGEEEELVERWKCKYNWLEKKPLPEPLLERT